GGLVEAETTALVTSGHRLGGNLALLELDDGLDAPQERVFDRRKRGLREILSGGLQQERVLAVLHARDDPLPRRCGWVGRLVALILVLRPVAGDRVDVEA